jgi:prolipoprotein diacylglyceryl transferase
VSRTIASVVGSIPSPSNGVLHLGPVPLHAYGLMLAIGVLVATAVAERRWRNAGHDPRDIGDIAIWIVIAGVVGARVYHLITDYQLYTHDWLKAFKIWDGGLSIWGAVGGGMIAVIVLTRVRHYDTLGIMDAIAPGLILAQAIGRWGNYFNQELFGGPTRLPWGLEISPSKRPPGYLQYSTFHPTFLYESLWCLAIFGILIWASHRFTLRKGQLFALYVALYTFGRFWFENMRIDPAHHVAGLRINAWVSLGLCIVGIVWFVYLGRHGTVDTARERAPDVPDVPAELDDRPPAEPETVAPAE